MSEDKETNSNSTNGEQRKTGIDIPVPWSKDPIKVRGLGAVLGGILALLGFNTYVLHMMQGTQAAWASALREMTCVMKIPPNDRGDIRAISECERQSRMP